MKKYLVLFASLIIVTSAHATTQYPSVFKNSEVRVFGVLAPTDKAIGVVISGRAAKEIYNSLSNEERPHRGLFLKDSADGLTNCERRINPSSYSCSLSVDR